MTRAHHADVVIVGSGMGGGTLAWALRDSGARVLLLERGGFLPSEPQNWSAAAVFGENRYKAKEQWRDASGGWFARCSLFRRWQYQGLWRCAAATAARGFWRDPARGGLCLADFL